MVIFFRLPILLLLGVLFTASSLNAQSDNLRVAVANVSEDLGLLIQQVKSMRLELESVQRENSRLRAQVASLEATVTSDTDRSTLLAALEAVRTEYKLADTSQRKEIVVELSKQINALAVETQSAINRISKAPKEPARRDVTVTFTEDYPTTGKPYVVRSGDSLSQIARDHGSTVKFIQNANKIVDPNRDLRVGDTIFIPISE